MRTSDDRLDEPDDPRIPCEDCDVRLDHHTGFMRVWRQRRDTYLCEACGEDYLETLRKEEER